METVAILGAGNMGTALAQVIAGNGHRVLLWSIETDVLEEIRRSRLNSKYLDGVSLHKSVEPVWGLAEALAEASVAIISVPSQVVGALARDMAPHVQPGQVLLNVAKGLEGGSHRRMSQVLSQELGEQILRSIGSMGGPAIAIEMARGAPMAVIVAFEDADACRRVQSVLQNEHLKVATSADLCGLELCAALKNVYGIALGICDGLGHGANTKAFLVSVALDEMSSICGALGGQRDTVYGLAGLGDLVTTGYSEHSRNRRLGEELGTGGDWRHFLRTNTVEGVGACRAAKELIEGRELAVHLLETLHEVLFQERPAPEAMRHFFREFSYG